MPVLKVKRTDNVSVVSSDTVWQQQQLVAVQRLH